MDEFKKSGEVIGRDKMYHKYNNSHKEKISSYIFHLHYKKLGIRSKSYHRAGKRPLKEIKYQKVWANDLLNGNSHSAEFGSVLHADIKYIKIKNICYYLHIILETIPIWF